MRPDDGDSDTDTAGDKGAGAAARRRFPLWRLLPLLGLGLGLVAFFAFGLGHYLSLDTLRVHRGALEGWVDSHGVVAVLAYIGLYAACTAFSLPVATLLSVTAGFLFGAVLGTLSVVVGATLGASLVFLAARTAFGEVLRARAGPWLRKMQAGFAENALSYMLFLRLVPVFPFWLVNLAPAFLGVALRTYVLGTFLGIIPGAFVFVFLGRGLGSILDAGADAGLKGLITPEIIIAFGLLGLLALFPVVYKKLSHRKRSAD